MDTPRHPIPAALARRAEAVELAAPRRDSPGYDDAQDEAGEILDVLSTLLCGDADALREVVPDGIRRSEVAYLVANHPEDEDVQRWLAAAAAYAQECRS